MATPEQSLKQGLERFLAHDYDGAIRVLESALESAPDDVEALRALAMSWFKQGDAARAVVLGERLAEIAPKDIIAWSSLSLFLMKAGRVKDAEDAAAKARTLAWKAQLRGAAPTNAPGLDVLDAPKAAPTSPPIMPGIALRKPPQKPPA